MAIKTLIKEIDYIYAEDGTVDHIQVDVSATNAPSDYANAHLTITEDDVAEKKYKLSDLNANYVGNLALQKARTYFQKITIDVTATNDKSATAKTATTGDTVGTASTTDNATPQK